LGAFAMIPFLIKKRMKLSNTIFLVTIIISVLSGIGIDGLAKTVFKIFTSANSLDTIITVGMVGMLGGLMKHYGILDGIVTTMLKVISNKKIVMMLIPSMIGVLVVPGGAVLSAPFINNLGEEMGIDPPKRAAINLIFRHISMFLLPFSTVLLFVKASIPEINIYKVIAFSLPFIAGVMIIAYYLYLRGSGNGKEIKSTGIGKNIIKLLVLTLPIYISVVINVVTGLPFFISMIGSVIAVYFLGSKEKFMASVAKSFNLNTVLMVLSILILKDVILQLDGMLSIVEGVLSGIGSGIGIMVVFTIVSIFFGYITGYPTSALAITLPLLSMMDMSANALHIYVYFLLVASFAGYFYSPLHLCQVLTLGEMKVGTLELYKEYRFYALLQLAVIYGTTLSMLMIFA
jgi:hypothetical protein